MIWKNLLSIFFILKGLIKITRDSLPNLIERFKSHNHLGTKGFTLKFRPWVVIHVEFFHSKSEAMKREKYLKTGIGREFIQNLIHKL